MQSADTWVLIVEPSFKSSLRHHKKMRGPCNDWPPSLVAFIDQIHNKKWSILLPLFLLVLHLCFLQIIFYVKMYSYWFHESKIRTADIYFKLLEKMKLFDFLEKEKILSWFMDSHFIIMVQQKRYSNVKHKLVT